MIIAQQIKILPTSQSTVKLKQRVSSSLDKEGQDDKAATRPGDTDVRDAKMTRGSCWQQDGHTGSGHRPTSHVSRRGTGSTAHGCSLNQTARLSTTGDGQMDIMRLQLP